MKLPIFALVLALACTISVAPAAPMPMPMPTSNDKKAHVFGVQGDDFIMDGKPVKIISGEIHYPRVPRAAWRDRMQRIKAMGMNTICTYLFWNAHEPTPGKWDFSGNLDVAEFCRMAQEEGLWVIVRPGPYVCAEWEFGGFPGWILADPKTIVRSQDPTFLKPALAYLERVCKVLAPLQLKNGGPIIMAQVENEYGSYGSDKEYVRKHLEVIKKHLPDTMPFTSDGSAGHMLANGPIDGVVAAMNFGGNPQGAFKDFRRKRPTGPLINGEFWCGWFDHWGNPKNGGNTDKFKNELKWMLENNVSPNLFMIHGGTSFGFMNGANWEGKYTPDVTNYDYGAPISESGKLTPRYHAFRQVIQDYYGDTYTILKPPADPKTITIAPITFTQMSGMMSNLPLPASIPHKRPVNMEALGQSLGFILYSTPVKGPFTGTLKLGNMQDRTHVYVNDKRVATIDRRHRADSCPIIIPAGHHTLNFFVENLGRINFGEQIKDERKGIRGPIMLGKKELENFSIYPLPCDKNQLASQRYSTNHPGGDQPVFYRATFDLADTGDVYLDMQDGWRKGVVWVNGLNLGRFWCIGSQQALYCHESFLKKGQNEIIVLDIDGGKGTVRGVADAIYAVRPDPLQQKNPITEGTPVQPTPAQRIIETTLANGTEWQTITLPAPIQARYIAIQTKSNYGDGNGAAIAELVFLGANKARIKQEACCVVYASSQETEGESAGASFVLDNQPTTFWHTKWQGSSPNHPHTLVIDLGRVQFVSGFQYLPRQDKANGRLKGVEIFASPTPFPAKK